MSISCKCCCKCCCCTTLGFAAVLVIMIVALLPVSHLDSFNLFMTEHYLPDYPNTYIAGYILMQLRDLSYCFGLQLKDDGLKAASPDGFKSMYLKCFKNQITMHYAAIYGEEGVAISPNGFKGGTGIWGPIFYSHKGYKLAVENPKAGRPVGMFILSNRSTLPLGVIPESLEKILLEFDTGDPEWKARRQLLSDALPALALDTSPIPPAAVLPSVSPQDGEDDKNIMRILGVTLFKWLFDVDVADEIELIIEYDNLFAPAVFGQFNAGEKGGKRLAEIRGILERKVAKGKIGQQLLELASARGMAAQTRLQETIWVVLFAAFGGTSNLAIQTVKHILSNPGVFVPLFKKDVDAFMLEAARLYPPVGGMNPMVLREPLKMKKPSGAVVSAPTGAWGLTITTGANRDPTIFEQPDDFKPGRVNADRLMTWNAELRDIRAGTSIRGCPGTHLALRLATAVVTVFVEGAELKLKEKQLSSRTDL